MIFYFKIFDDYGISAEELIYDIKGNFFNSPTGTTYTSKTSGKSYTATEQEYILGVSLNKSLIINFRLHNMIQVVQATYYLGLVMCQVAHLMFCRTNTTSIFIHGWRSNSYATGSIIVEVLLGCVAVYLPGWQLYVMEVRNPNSLYVLYIFLLAFALLGSWAELRKLYTRNYPTHAISKILAW